MEFESKPIKPADLESASQQDDKAGKFCEWIRAWETRRQGIEPRWDQIDSQIQGDPAKPKELPWPGFIYSDIPMLQAKSQAWEAYVCNAPLSTTPFLVGTMFNQKATTVKTVEQDIYLLMRMGGFSRIFRQVTHSTGAYGKGIWRVRPAADRHGRIIFEYKSVPMRKFFIYPDIPEGIEAAKIVGHTFELRVSEIKAMQDAGDLWEGVEVTGKKLISDNPQTKGPLDRKESIAKEPEDYPVRLAEVFYKAKYAGDDKEKWYRAWVAADEKKLLAIWDYQFSRPWYFDQFVHEEEGGFLPLTSRFYDGMGIQLAINELWNTMKAGSEMGAFPTTFASGWSLPQKYAKTKPGQVVPLTNGGKIDQVQSRYDASVTPTLLNDLYKRASEVFRIDEQQEGVKTSGDQTATAAQIRQGGSQVAITDDLANIDVCMGQIGAFQQEVFKIHYIDFLESYGDSLATQPDEQTQEKGYPAILDEPIIWELLGRSPMATPMAQSQAAMQLFQQLGTVCKPEVLQGLIAMGINVGGMLQEIISNTTLENRAVIFTNPGTAGEDPDKTAQAMDQMAQKLIQMNNQPPPPPPPKPPTELIKLDYATASPFVQAQIEKLFGMEPDPAHAQGMPHMGSDGHKNLASMQNDAQEHQLKMAQLAQKGQEMSQKATEHQHQVTKDAGDQVLQAQQLQLQAQQQAQQAAQAAAAPAP